MAIILKYIIFIWMCVLLVNTEENEQETAPFNESRLGLSSSEAARLEALSDLAKHGHKEESANKEKRCHDFGLDLHDSIVGSALNPQTIIRRDIQKELKNKQCETCLENPLCKLHGNCEICNALCKDYKSQNSLPEKAVSLSTRFKEEEAEDGLSENQERYYTVGAVGVGPKQAVISRLLNIPRNIIFERLIIIAKDKSKSKIEGPPHPVVIDTAHVFTKNEGEPREVDFELHNVKTDDTNLNLTRKLNKELDAAIDTKKKMIGDSHLTPEEIDKVITHAIGEDKVEHTGQTRLEDEETAKLNVGEKARSEDGEMTKLKVGEKAKSEDEERTKSNVGEKARSEDEDRKESSLKKKKKKKKIRTNEEGETKSRASYDGQEGQNHGAYGGHEAEQKQEGYDHQGLEQGQEGYNDHATYGGHGQEAYGNHVQDGYGGHKQETYGEQTQDTYGGAYEEQGEEGHNGHEEGNYGNGEVDGYAENLPEYAPTYEENGYNDKGYGDNKADQYGGEAGYEEGAGINQYGGHKGSQYEEHAVHEGPQYEESGKGGYEHDKGYEQEYHHEDYNPPPTYQTKNAGYKVEQLPSQGPYVQSKQASAPQIYQSPQTYAIPQSASQKVAYEPSQTAYAPPAEAAYALPPPAQVAYAPPPPAQRAYAPPAPPTAYVPQEPLAVYSPPVPQATYKPSPPQPLHTNIAQPKYHQESYDNSNDLSEIELEDDLPEYAPTYDYTVGASKPNISSSEAPEDLKLRASWYESEYTKLKQWVRDNLLGQPAPSSASPQLNESLVDEFTNIIKNDLEGYKLNQTTNKLIDDKISKLIEENLGSKNESTPRVSEQLDEIVKDLDDDKVVNLENIQEFKERFKSVEEEKDTKNLLGLPKLKEQLKKDSVMLGKKWSQTGENILGKKPLVDPNLINLKSVVKDLSSVPNYFMNKVEKVADALQPRSKNIKKESVEDNNIPNVALQSKLDDDQLGKGILDFLLGDKLEQDEKNETVGCSLENLKNSGEHMYLQPYPYGYRNADKPGKKLLSDLDKIFHPKKAEESNEQEESKPKLKNLIKDLEKLTLPTLPPLKHKHSTTIPTIKINDRPYDENRFPPTPDRLDEFPPQIPPQFQGRNNQFFQTGNNQPEFNDFNPLERMHGEHGGHGHSHGVPPSHSHHHHHNFVRDDIIGAQNQLDTLSQQELNMFGKLLPENPQNRNAESQAEEHKMYFVGDGIKLPLHMVRNADGTMHLSVDMEKLCKCNNSLCENITEPLNPNQQNTLVDAGDIPLQMANPNMDLNPSQLSKRSPNNDDVYAYNIEMKTKGDGNVDDYEYKFKNLEGKIRNFENDIKKYYENEKQLVEDIEGERSEDLDSSVQKRVGLLKNVLSWMKEVAVDEAKHRL